MRTNGRALFAYRCAVWVGAIVTAPLLVVIGGPVYHRLQRHLYREGGPGLLDKRRGWVHPGYWIVLNPVIRGLTWPTRRIERAVRNPFPERRRP